MYDFIVIYELDLHLQMLLSNGNYVYELYFVYRPDIDSYVTSFKLLCFVAVFFCLATRGQTCSNYD